MLLPNPGLAPVPESRDELRLDEAHGPAEKDKKYRYGAWYLPAESWKWMERSAPLIDPEEIEKK